MEDAQLMLKDFATSIVQTLRQHGFQAYLVGGCVRDLLLQRRTEGLRRGDECDAAAGDGHLSGDVCRGSAVRSGAGAGTG